MAIKLEGRKPRADEYIVSIISNFHAGQIVRDINNKATYLDCAAGLDEERLKTIIKEGYKPSALDYHGAALSNYYAGKHALNSNRKTQYYYKAANHFANVLSTEVDKEKASDVVAKLKKIYTYLINNNMNNLSIFGLLIKPKRVVKVMRIMIIEL